MKKNELKMNKDYEILRDGFLIGKIDYFEDGLFSCYAFIPEEGVNLNLREVNLIKKGLEKIEKISKNKELKNEPTISKANTREFKES